jgi:hypothetical protein
MFPPTLGITEQSHARDLELILRSTHSFLAFHTPYLRQGRSLRILDLALLTAIADLQELDAPAPALQQNSECRAGCR